MQRKSRKKRKRCKARDAGEQQVLAFCHTAIGNRIGANPRIRRCRRRKEREGGKGADRERKRERKEKTRKRRRDEKGRRKGGEDEKEDEKKMIRCIDARRHGERGGGREEGPARWAKGEGRWTRRKKRRVTLLMAPEGDGRSDDRSLRRGTPRRIGGDSAARPSRFCCTFARFADLPQSHVAPPVAPPSSRLTINPSRNAICGEINLTAIPSRARSRLASA